MSNLSETVHAFASGTYLVTRTTQGEYVKGRAGPTTTTNFSTPLSVQPMSGQELLRLPEGMRTRETLVAFSPVPLYPVTDTVVPDVVTVKGKKYEVTTVDDWSSLGGYWRATLVRAER